MAGKSTLNRMERAPAGEPTRYHKIGHDAAVIERLRVDLFLDAQAAPPKESGLDRDAPDDPIHGAQEGRFFHGYHGCYGYLPLYVFCGDHLLAAKLRRSSIAASAGAVAEVARIVAPMRARWPLRGRRAGLDPCGTGSTAPRSMVRIVLRADSAFAREALMGWCEANAVDYVLGLARNPRLVGEIAAELAVSAALTSRRGIGPEARWPRPRPRRPASRRADSRTSATRRWAAGAARAGSSAKPSSWPAAAARRAPTR